MLPSLQVNMKTIFITIARVKYFPNASHWTLAAAILALAILPLCARAEGGLQPAPTPEASQEQPRPIQDNSFLIEEAYNQEFGVVQHINAFIRDFSSHSWAYSFTQEWPVPGVKHQLSYTLSALRDATQAGAAGFGDVALNYRYQMVGDGDARVAFAPRATLLIPTGNIHARRGFGGYGGQVNLPLSVVINEHLVTHWNAGTTIVPQARNESGDQAAVHGYNLGQSLIWLVRPRFNVMLETVWAGAEQVVGRGQTQRNHDLLISPGVRWAYNFKNGLQIVPGIGVPIGVGPSAGEKGVFLYLSFEHPFRALKRN
jgi:hypothetical protein